ncbi:MAG: hypothetical protein J0H00_15605 [Burkholderiales bacterium]|nr:hypothetical protein [Burkholderiales bacterium]OJX07550.1 MAG: hypothetical protein BGO72_08905 [Burkholderiales bacterium 70-64]
MRSTVLAGCVAIVAATIGGPLLAGDRANDRNQARERQPATATSRAGGFDSGMQVIVNGAGPGEAGYGWRYFSDPGARRAVVISPQGDYYFSRGKGLRWVAAVKT